MTGISGLPAGAKPAADTRVYDLRGRFIGTRLTREFQPGIYIVGGSKVVVK